MWILHHFYNVWVRSLKKNLNFFIKILSSTDIRADLDDTLGEFAPSFTTVKRYVADFKLSSTATQGSERFGRPESATSEEIQKIQKNIMNDRRQKLTNVAEIADVLTERAITFADFGPKKCNA